MSTLFAASLIAGCASNMPAIGIKGNSHMLMMDRSNMEVAAVIQQWLVKQGLTH